MIFYEACSIVINKEYCGLDNVEQMGNVLAPMSVFLPGVPSSFQTQLYQVTGLIQYAYVIG